MLRAGRVLGVQSRGQDGAGKGQRLGGRGAVLQSFVPSDTSEKREGELLGELSEDVVDGLARARQDHGFELET